ncbi:MAG: hypothetical protein V1911_01345 [Candidatus Micrarchaeota archaeon]
MKTLAVQEEILHYPNLKTVLMVEEALKEADGPITREELKRRLPKQVMTQTLNIILAYFEEKGMILDGHKGISYLEPPNAKLKKLIEGGIRV